MDKSTDWLAEWNRTIGGSRAAAVLGKSRFQGKLETWREMKGLVDLAKRQEISPDLRRGILLEPIARALIAQEFGRPVDEHDQNDFVYRDSMPWAHCLPDGWTQIERPDAAGSTILQDSPLEIKVPRPGQFYKALINGISEEHNIQCQHNMMVLDFDWILFVMLNCITMDILCITVERDPRLCKRICQEEQRFYESLSLDVPPDWLLEDDAEKRSGAATDAPPSPDGEVSVCVTPAAVAAAMAYAQSEIAYREAEEAKDAAKSRLRSLFGGGKARILEVPNIVRGHLIEMEGRRTVEDLPLALQEFPGLAKYLRVGKSFEQFRVYLLGEHKSLI